MNAVARKTVPLFKKIAYAAPAFALAVVGIPIYVYIPNESLGPDITFDYHERISLFGVRDGFLIAGTLAAASSPALVEWFLNLSHTAQGERTKFYWTLVIYAPLVIGKTVY